MKLEQITVSRELCMLLKRHGYPQDDSLFYRFKGDNKVYDGRNINKSGKSFETQYFAAPVDAELDALLPAEYMKGTSKFLTISKRLGRYYADYSDAKNPDDNLSKVLAAEKSSADVKARLFINLKKKGVI